MSESISNTRPRNIWFGVGIDVEGQSMVAGVSCLMAKMWSYPDTNSNCLIRVSGQQLGPGLGGSGNVVLVIATGISSPQAFQLVAIDGGGMHFSLAVGADFAAATAALQLGKACREASQVMKAFEVLNIAKIADHPWWLPSLKRVVDDARDTVIAGSDAMYNVPRLMAFPLGGGGFELSLTYRWNNSTELVQL